MKIRITPRLVELFREHRFSTAPFGAERFTVGTLMSVREGAIFEDYASIFAGQNLPMRFGAFSYSHSGLNPQYAIGRYCSIAPGCTIMGSAHPADWVTTSPFTHNPEPVSGFSAYLADRGADPLVAHQFERGNQNVTIGNDVWLGETSLLKRGVTVGDGAIVAARAIVTHDVPPYAIVGGAPAKIIRFRFPEQIVERLLRSEWWRFGPDQLQPLDMRSPETFLDRFDQAVADGLEPPSLSRFTGAEVIAAGEPVQ